MNQNFRKIITIDGPAGAGKSTMARELARRLTWIYLDTGALYRAIALTALRRGVDPADQPAAEELARSLKITALPGPNGTSIIVDGEDVTEQLRKPEVSLGAATISAWPGVREVLLSIQRGLGDEGKVVVEGRDMGTVVFPDAGLKLFLYADPEARAKRRFTELTAKGENVSFDGVLADQSKRDEADQSRPVSPLKAAPDAVTINTTNLSIEDVLQVMVNAFRNRFFCKTDD
ncbi:(d)CMP kinase [Deltaproteobacteria bacterium Smac51]|nr:(d)CMP kinase [Deltaproteobacteria bacterium Smac51]